MLLEVFSVRQADPGELNSCFSDKQVRTKWSLGGTIDADFAERPEESAFHNYCCNFPCLSTSTLNMKPAFSDPLKEG